MQNEDINKFVGELYKDKENLIQNLSDLLVKLGVVVLHDTNAMQWEVESEGKFPPGGVLKARLFVKLKSGKSLTRPKSVV